MRWKIILLVCLMGCATLKTNKDGSSSVEYTGTADGAVEIVSAQNRRLEIVQAGNIGKQAVDKNMPVALRQDAGQSDLQVGWMYSSAYGGWGYAANAFGVSPALLGVQQVPAQVPLPILSSAPAAVIADGTQIVPCPKNRPAQTVPEQAACAEQMTKVLLQKKKH